MEKLYSVYVSKSIIAPGELPDFTFSMEIQRLPLKNAVSFAARLFESSFSNIYVFDFEKSEIVAFMIHLDQLSNSSF